MVEVTYTNVGEMIGIGILALYLMMALFMALMILAVCLLANIHDGDCPECGLHCFNKLALKDHMKKEHGA